MAELGGGRAQQNAGGAEGMGHQPDRSSVLARCAARHVHSIEMNRKPAHVSSLGHYVRLTILLYFTLYFRRPGLALCAICSIELRK